MSKNIKIEATVDGKKSDEYVNIEVTDKDTIDQIKSIKQVNVIVFL
jgi:hypothetical protein